MSNRERRLHESVKNEGARSTPRGGRISSVVLAILACAYGVYAVWGAGGRAVSLALAVGLSTSIALPATWRAHLAINAVVGTVLLVGGELYLGARFGRRSPGVASGDAADRRTLAEVVRDARAAGVDAAPAPNRGEHQLELYGRRVWALGGVSLSQHVLCNETGTYVWYASDRHGFNNPDTVWSLPRVDVALIGDSFTQGWCVPQEYALAGRVRRAIPATVNLGVSGSGPLNELAVLREYGSALRPRVVAWIYFENDLRDLALEARDEQYTRYLADSGALGMIDMQRQIDLQLRAKIDDRLAKLPAGNGGWWRAFKRSDVGRRLDAARHFDGWRTLLRTYVPSLLTNDRASVPCCDVALFRRVLDEARSEVQAWGGDLLFVFIPAPTRYSRTAIAYVYPAELESRQAVVDGVKSLGIPVLDVDSIIRRRPDPDSLWIPGGHMSEAGYAIIARALVNAVTAHLSRPTAATSASVRARRF